VSNQAEKALRADISCQLAGKDYKQGQLAAGSWQQKIKNKGKDKCSRKWKEKM